MISWGQDHAKKEAALRERLAHEEETRRKARGSRSRMKLWSQNAQTERQVIARNEAAHLEQEALNQKRVMNCYIENR